MSVFPNASNFRFIASSIPKHFSVIHYGFVRTLSNMPKEPKHIAEAQKQRLKIKQRSAKYSPGKVTIQILGTGARGAPRSVYLFSDQSRYLFNCGEGSQRLAHEHKTKLAKLEHIFITQCVWKNMGGLPGTSLTIQDVGVPEITLHGPAGVGQLFPATRRFVVLRDLRVKIADCSDGGCFEDNVLKVKYVPLVWQQVESNEKEAQVSVEQNEAGTSTRRQRKRYRQLGSSSGSSDDETLQDDTDYYAHERKRRRRSRSRSRSRSRDSESGSRVSPENEPNISEILLDKKVMCYLCQLQPRPGALDFDKCVKNGVPPGPLLGKLKNGEDVTLSNGTVVKSVDVCEPDDPGPIFLVVDCPSLEYLDSLVTNEELKKHQKYCQSDEQAACLVLHFTPKEIMDLPEYKKWMDDFIASTDHIAINEANKCMGSIAVHRIQHKLHLLSPNIFPLLGDKGTPVLIQEKNNVYHQNKRQKCEEVGLDGLKIDNEATRGLIQANSFYKTAGALSCYYLRPRKGFDCNSHITLDPEEYTNETNSLSGFPEALGNLNDRLMAAKSDMTFRDYPRILFLGTGSCIPNKTRNTSGILLQMSDNKNMVLDCGEGTYGQLVRFFGENKCDEMVANIEAVYISHLHADHHIGLIGLLQGRREAFKRLDLVGKPVYLFAPKQILAWLTFYDKCFESISDEYILVPNSDLDTQHPISPEITAIFDKLDLKKMSTCLVRHCPNAFGVNLVHKSGYNLTYSGDTMPSNNLINIGKGSDVLIHEATMEDDLAKEAVIKMHSTTSQAINVGKEMQAKLIILTHFSQRYAKLPRFNPSFDSQVCIAFDNMYVKFDELPLVPLFYPALKIMFAEHYEEMEHRATKRQLKTERQASLDRSGNR